VSIFTAVTLGAVAATGLGGEGVIRAQQSGTTSPIVLPRLDSPDWGPKVRMTPEQARAMKEERHKRAQADLEKMTGLISELNSEFVKTSKDVVSVTVLKKAKEIEKLARDVQSQEKDIARERGSGQRESGGEVELGLLHVPVEGR
jgi:hypothetical protein